MIADQNFSVRFRTARESELVKMYSFAMALLLDLCKYAKAPEGDELFLFFDNLASGY
jgi:hypothetical protein